ncbi:MAG: cyclic pyranopterin monophosphate synthase MoaC [Bacteroidales bacterium]
MKKKFSHTDEGGKARMVDVGDKPVQQRSATARGFIRLHPDTLVLVAENQLKKGDVLTVAEIAGIQAAKKTSSLIPLCHPLQITKVEVTTRILGYDVARNKNKAKQTPSETAGLADEVPENQEGHMQGIEVCATVRCNGQTGVEMEALTAAATALLTIYDMCKAVDKNMVIEQLVLLEKTKK